MNQVDTSMPKSVPVLARVSPELKAKLRTLAKNTDRSESYLVAQAIAEYVELNAWQVREIKQRLDEAKAGAPGVSHERVVEWLRSWGTDHELPPPKPEADT